MAHGYSAVKEMYLDRFAEVFAAAGLAAIVFDNRNFGASDGEPRQEINPWQQVEDYRDAISFAQTLPETDAERIGVWGSSYSGAHVLVLGAIDRRIKCVASQVPLISGHRNARRLIRADVVAGVEAMCAEDRLRRYKGGEPGMIPVVVGRPGRYRRAADAGFLALVRRNRQDTGAGLAQRGDLALGGAVPRLRAGSLHRVCEPDAASARGRARRSSDGRRRGAGRL